MLQARLLARRVAGPQTAAVGISWRILARNPPEPGIYLRNMIPGSRYWPNSATTGRFTP